jgi:Fur family transcriptional regulator, stress-responsive regulator
MLRGVALRVTRPRVAVLSAVHDHPHANTDSIIRVVREDLGAVSNCAVGYTPCLTASDDHGFRVDEAEVIYWGRCPECVAATSVASGG